MTNNLNSIDAAFAQRFANGWVDAWNSRELDKILAHYADDFTFQSPMITVVTGEPSGRLQGKEAVGSYWAAALKKLPDLHFKLMDTLLGAQSLTLYYRGHRGLVAETFFFNDERLVTHATANYSLV